jgi:hypothetical protein
MSPDAETSPGVSAISNKKPRRRVAAFLRYRTARPQKRRGSMRRFDVFLRWLLGLVRILPSAVGGPNVYSKAWEDRGIPGDGL